MRLGDEEDGRRRRHRGPDRGAGAGAARRPSRRRRSTCAGWASMPTRLHGANGFDRIEALRDAVDALYTSDEAKRRFEIMARQVFVRFKALLMEPSASGLCRAARQHRGDLQEAAGPARHGRRDRAAQGAAPDRQRGDPRRRRRATTTPKG